MNSISQRAVRLILCACPAPEVADEIATALVEARLAACVSRTGPVTSTYRWEGQVARAEEVLLLIKTTVGACAALTSRLRELHPYELPEIIAVPVGEGLPDYLNWVADQVAIVE